MFHGPGRRMFGRGDFRLILLELIARSPKHGYSLIEEIEQLTGGVYSPSPGIIYPALLFLEEAGLIESVQENNRKIYRITERGSAALAENRERIDFILDRIARFGSFFAGRHGRDGRRWFWAKDERRGGEAEQPKSATPRDFVAAALSALESTVALARGRVPEAVLVDRLRAVEKAIADAAMGAST